MLTEIDAAAVVRVLHLRKAGQPHIDAFAETLSNGVEGIRVAEFLRRFGIDRLAGAEAVGVGPNAHAWFSHGRLNHSQTANALEIVDLLCRALEVFGSEASVAAWLSENPRALAGTSPLGLLKAGRFREFNTLLGRITHGVYS